MLDKKKEDIRRSLRIMRYDIDEINRRSRSLMDRLYDIEARLIEDEKVEDIEQHREVM